jgi:hypothetical protein
LRRLEEELATAICDAVVAVSEDTASEEKPFHTISIQHIRKEPVF